VRVVETDLPLADSSAAAAASHVAQHEISRESRHHQTDNYSYSYSYSSSRTASTSRRIISSSRMWLHLATISAVVHHLTLASSRWCMLLMAARDLGCDHVTYPFIVTDITSRRHLLRTSDASHI